MGRVIYSLEQSCSDLSPRKVASIREGFSLDLTEGDPRMKSKRYTEEQIIGILKENEAGVPVSQVLRRHGIANGTFYRWKSKYGGMEVSQARRLHEPEAGHARRKKHLADTLLEKRARGRVTKKW